MSFTTIEQATPRLHRSELAVPGSNPSMFEKAARCAADIVFLDLEDAVAPDDKEQARRNIIQALNEVDWGSRTMMIRINGLESHLSVMCDFWETVLFRAGLYQGSAVRAHQPVHDRHQLTAAHFGKVGSAPISDIDCWARR